MPLTHAQKTGLEAAILAYLAAEGGRFARTVAAFKEESQLQDGTRGADDSENELVVSGEVLGNAWAMVYRGLNTVTQKEALFDAIASGDLATVQLYVCVGVDVETLRRDLYYRGYFRFDDDGEVSPLFWAAYYNRLEMVQLFVNRGHDKEVRDKEDTTPLNIAAHEGHIAVVQYLVEQGVTVDTADGYGKTPLYVAASNNHVAMVRYLAEHGADTDKTANDEGWTPLILAAMKCEGLALVQCLVEQGADKDKADISGDTPLMEACAHGHVDIVEYLLDQRCNGDCTNNTGMTALHYAAIRGCLDLADVLFRYGVKLDVRDNDGFTPADLATAFGHHAFADAVRAEEIRRFNHGFKRDRSTIVGTEEYEAAKRPRVEEPAVAAAEEVDESDDDDDDDDDEEEEG